MRHRLLEHVSSKLQTAIENTGSGYGLDEGIRDMPAPAVGGDTAPAPTDATPAPERDPLVVEPQAEPEPEPKPVPQSPAQPELEQKVQAESAAESSPANDSGSASDFSDFDIPDLGGSDDSHTFGGGASSDDDDIDFFR